MPYCSNCGGKLNDSDNFCEDCGRKRVGKTVEKVDTKVAINNADTKLAIKETYIKATAKEEKDKIITNPIKSRVRELRSVIFTLRMFSVFLESIIIFMFCVNVFSLIGMNIALALMTAFAYFMIQFATVIDDQKTIKKIVIKYPTLDEKLQTAYDNGKTSNASAGRLIAEVSEKLDEMRSSDFINFKDVFIKVLVIIILCFSFLSIHLVEIQEAWIHLERDPGDISIALVFILFCSLFARFFLINLNPGEKHDPSKEFKPKETGDKSVGNTQLFCSKCDRPILDTYVYCRYCGSKLGVGSVYEKETQKEDHGAMAIYRNSRFFYRCSKLFHSNNSAHIERKRLLIK